MSTDLWLPKGFHHDLHIEFDRTARGAGPFVLGAGWKVIWHITVSPWLTVDSMVNVLHLKSAEPHLVIGGRRGVKHPVVVQTLPFNVAGKAMQHTLPQETNRARCIQVEICAQPGTMSAVHGEVRDAMSLFTLPGVELGEQHTEFYMRAVMRADTIAADNYNDHVEGTDEAPHIDLCISEPDVERVSAFRDGVGAWGDTTYAALGNLGRLIERRVPVERKLARRFNNAGRFTGPGFVEAKGHAGHMHAPGNTHVDPTTAFKGTVLLDKIASAPNKLPV